MSKNRKKLQVIRENIRELSQYVKLVESNHIAVLSTTLLDFIASRGGKSKYGSMLTLIKYYVRLVRAKS